MTTYNGYTESDDQVKARLALAWKRHLEIVAQQENQQQEPTQEGEA